MQNYEFNVGELTRLKIISKILSHYRLGFLDSSNIPGEIKENESPYRIDGTRGETVFTLCIEKDEDGGYKLLCIPEYIERYK